MINTDLIVIVLLLLACANGAPVLARIVFGKLFSQPLDSGKILADGQPLFGSSKTIRGLIAAIVTTTFVAPILEVPPGTGFVIACLAMTGDLFSSFLKRRNKLESSSKATGLDQIPESLLPAIAGMYLLDLSLFDVLVIVVLFFVLEKLLSQIFYKLGIRKHPY